MKNETTYVGSTISEIQAATNNLDVASIVPLHINDNGVMKEVKEWKGVYNNTKGKFCTAVVPHYNLVQHREYFQAVAQSLNRLNINFTMTIKQSGNRAFGDIDFKGRDIKFTKLNEEFATGLRITNSYDKTYGLSVVSRFTRLACTNGMIITRSDDSTSLKHHAVAVRDIDGFISKRINEIISSSSDLQNWVSQSMGDSKEWKICCSIIAKLFEQMKHREEVLKRLGISIVEVTDKKTKKKSITYVWNDDTQKKSKFNRWDIYNAITNYISHGEHMTPHIESLFHHKAQKLLTTPLEKMPMAKISL